jgi:hypothetical protein
MPKHPLTHKVHFAAGSRTIHSDLLALTVLLLGSLAVPASAQNRPVARVAPERHFTIPPDIPTSVVLMTEPDAACDLHTAGVNDPSHTMRLYGNIEGYVQFHFTPNQDIQDAHLQLDCTTQEAVTTHPLHLRIAASPTEDMPAPERSVPAPRGSKILPALTDEAARQLSDEDIIAQGYAPRPNATESPEAYVKWLDRVSRSITLLPPHSVSRSDISHLPQGVTEGLSGANNNHWSGFVATGSAETYKVVYGDWVVPFVSGDPSGQGCFSSVWAGLDGYPPSNDVVQAGTEQDAQDLSPSGTATTYYAWTEVVPQQPTAHQVLSVNPGSTISVAVWVGDSKGSIDPHGSYAWFNIVDVNSGQEFKHFTKLGTTFGFTASTAEWIVERPLVDGGFFGLSDYGIVQMSSALVQIGSKTIPYSTAANVQITMRNENQDHHTDNNVLSTVSLVTGEADWMRFYWKNFY